MSLGSFNSTVFNRVVWNGGGGVAAPIVFVEPLAIDDRTFAVTWEDDRTFALASYAMTKTGVKIKNVVMGDDRRVKRQYTGLPTGATINKAWLTIKKKETAADADALVQVSVTTTATDSGEIMDEVTDSGTLAMYFDLSRDDTANAKANLDYFYDIQIKRDDGAIHTLEKGTISFIRGVTAATS